MRTIGCIFFLLCVVSLHGCNSYNPVTLSIANREGTPIAGAHAVAAPMYFFNPTDESHLFVGAYEILEPFPAESDQGFTDIHGNVTLQIVTESPLQLHVHAEGFTTWEGQIAINTQGDPEIDTYATKSTIQVELDQSD